MYLLDLEIKGVKLLRDFSLSLRDKYLIPPVVRRAYGLNLSMPA
jgi:hypothetical protein